MGNIQINGKKHNISNFDSLKKELLNDISPIYTHMKLFLEKNSKRITTEQQNKILKVQDMVYQLELLNLDDKKDVYLRK